MTASSIRFRSLEAPGSNYFMSFVFWAALCNFTQHDSEQIHVSESKCKEQTVKGALKVGSFYRPSSQHLQFLLCTETC